MKERKDRSGEKGAIEIIEEATHLLRHSSADLFFSYYLGALPFVLGLLYFWTDVSRVAYAERSIAAAAFSLTLLYIWMKCWQAVFCARIYSSLIDQKMPDWSWRRILRLVVVQTAIQPTSFIVLPVSAILLFPFAWVYSYYHNVSVTGNGENSGIRENYRRAWRQARLFPAQNHIFITIYFLFGIFVLINMAALIYLAPQLLNTFLGIETALSRASRSMFNTTFLITTISASWLVLNPLAKTVYTLRCFYGESLQTGADLQVELKKFAARAKTIAAVIVCTIIINVIIPVCLAGAAPGNQTNPAPLQIQTISPQELDHSIAEVIAGREYRWRMPKEKILKKEDDGMIQTFIAGMIDTIKSWLKPVKKWLKKALDWLDDKLLGWLKPQMAEKSTASNWLTSLRFVLYALIGIAVLVLAFVLWRVYQNYRSGFKTVNAVPSVPQPDISRPDILADELPEKGWLTLAENLAAAGDLRGALRALFLATLARLSQEGVIIIARFKSNRDYERELRLKIRQAPEMLQAFSGNMRTYESVWYGTEQVTDATIKYFQENQMRIEAGAEKL